MNERVIVIGASAGGLNVLMAIAQGLPSDFQLPIIVAQHISPLSDGFWISYLDGMSYLTVKEADEKERIEKKTMYIAPPNYHLLVEKDETFSLSVGEKINYARPSIDVLFESAADVYRHRLIGVVLTGSSSDGAIGLRTIKACGGLAIVESPDTAEYSYMPEAVIAATEVDYILPIEEIIRLFITINRQQYPT